MCCCRGCRYDPKEALGLPPKSVRAIIGLISCVIIYLVEAYLVIVLVQKEKYDLGISVGGAMLAELSGIIGYYFGSRSSSSSNSSSDPNSNLNTTQIGLGGDDPKPVALVDPKPVALVDIESQIDNQSSLEE